MSHAFAKLVRVNLTTGAVDQPFGAPSVTVGDLAYDPTTDTLYVGASKSGNLPYAVPSPNGASPSSAATSWGTWGLGTDGCSSLAVADDGSLYGVSYTIATKTSYVHVGPAGAGAWGTAIGNFVSKTSAIPSRLLWGPDGSLYLGSEFDSITPGGAVYGLARWNGASWSPLGGRVVSSALSGTTVTNLAFDPQGRLHISGNILQYGSTPAPLRAIAGNPEYGHAGYVVYTGNTMHAEGVVCNPTYTDRFNTPYVFVSPADGSVMVATNGNSMAPACAYAPATTVTCGGTAPTPFRLRIAWPSSASGPLVFGALRNERTGKGIYFRGLWLYPGETLTIDTTPGRARAWTDKRGNVSRYMVGMSDLETLTLLPGANYITVLDFANGNTGTAVCTMTWRNRHTSIDGAGSAVVQPDFSAL